MEDEKEFEKQKENIRWIRKDVKELSRFQYRYDPKGLSERQNAVLCSFLVSGTFPNDLSDALVPNSIVASYPQDIAAILQAISSTLCSMTYFFKALSKDEVSNMFSSIYYHIEERLNEEETSKTVGTTLFALYNMLAYQIIVRQNQAVVDILVTNMMRFCRLKTKHTDTLFQAKQRCIFIGFWMLTDRYWPRSWHIAEIRDFLQIYGECCDTFVKMTATLHDVKPMLDACKISTRHFDEMHHEERRIFSSRLEQHAKFRREWTWTFSFAHHALMERLPLEHLLLRSNAMEILRSSTEASLRCVFMDIWHREFEVDRVWKDLDRILYAHNVVKVSLVNRWIRSLYLHRDDEEQLKLFEQRPDFQRLHLIVQVILFRDAHSAGNICYRAGCYGKPLVPLGKEFEYVSRFHKEEQKDDILTNDSATVDRGLYPLCSKGCDLARYCSKACEEFSLEFENHKDVCKKN